MSGRVTTATEESTSACGWRCGTRTQRSCGGKRRMSSWLQRFLPVPIGRVVAEVLPPPATVTRAEIVAALDDIIEHEEGPRFQSLAVILARQTYPQLIASERKCGTCQQQ